MSRITSALKEAIENLQIIQTKLTEIDQTQDTKDLNKLCFDMQLQINTLQTSIESLYKYTGSSKSKAKIAASRENGKKGGRPPKAQSEMKKLQAEKIELQNTITEINKKIEYALNFEEETNLRNQLENCQKRLVEISQIEKK